MLILLIILYLFDYIDFFLYPKKQATEVACLVLAWLTLTSGRAR